MILRNARLIFPDRIQPRSDLRILEGKIAAHSDHELPPQRGEEVIDLGGQFLAPGFIDLHIHGALRRDTMEATDDAFRAICRFHAAGGTTSLALTTITAPPEEILNVIRAVERYRALPPDGARILGVHIEGPYFSREKPGAHVLELIRNPDRAEWSHWLEHSAAITQVTVAPELPGALAFIEACAARGIRVSGGHSDAWDEDAAAGFAHGMRQVTHTYNCMSTARRRGPYRVAGLLEFALSEPEILCELIADGRHVSPTLMRMLYQAKGPDGIALVTDAMAGAGLPEETAFSLVGIPCIVRDGVGLTADSRVLAGSCATMISVVRGMVNLAGIPLHEAIRMATLNPALALHRSETIGTLRPGSDADLVVFDDDFTVSATYVGGQRVVGEATKL